MSENNKFNILKLITNISSWFFGINAILVGISTLLSAGTSIKSYIFGLFFLIPGIFVLPIINSRLHLPSQTRKNIIWISPLFYVLMVLLAFISIINDLR
jgi:hypothetical protein